MFLAIDIGNTTSSFGLFDSRKYLYGFELPSEHTFDFDELGAKILNHLEHQIPVNKVISKVGICSVVPDLTQKYISMAEKYLKVTPEMLRADKGYGFKIAYDDLKQLGADRLANVIAVRELYGYPAIVVDLGTATKFEVIDSSGDYLGGLIAPGVGISVEALFSKAARLFPVTYDKPASLIGTNTAACLKSGIYYGFLGQLKWVINSIKAQCGYRDMKIVGTGGLLHIFASEPDLFSDIDPELTLRGLQIALDQ